MKKNKKIVYKVVKPSDGRYGDRFKSINSIDSIKYCLSYKIGERTTAKVGSLFVFEKYEDAVSFRSRIGSIILKCETDKISKPTFEFLPTKPRNIKRFWTDPSSNSHLAVWEVPEGTVFCDYVIPIELIKVSR